MALRGTLGDRCIPSNHSCILSWQWEVEAAERVWFHATASRIDSETLDIAPA